MKDPKQAFNAHNPPPVNPEQTYTRQEVEEKIDNYSLTAEQEQYVFLQRLKNKYLGEQDKRDQDRTVQDHHYAMGVSRGLPHASHERLKADRENQDQKLRREVVENARQYYHQNHSLSREYNQYKKQSPKLSTEAKQHSKR